MKTLTLKKDVKDSGVMQIQTIIEPRKGLLFLELGAIWEYRELLYFLVWRDIKVRYKQTALGVFWIVLQPLISMIVFSGLFGSLLQVPTGNIPYPLFSLAALLPWNYFAGSLTRSSNSLVGSQQLITKVYFPRVILPISGVLAGLIDLAVSFVLMAFLLLFYRVHLTSNILFLPLFLLLAIVTALSFSLWFSALNVRYRDVIYIIPYLLQVWMFITPVIYSSTLIPEKYRFLLVLNPMSAVVEGFRWSLLGVSTIDMQKYFWGYVISVVIVIVVLLSGMVFFRTTERSFADII